MDNRTTLCFGALLHDIGKVVLRSTSAQQAHSELGARFLEGISDNNSSLTSIESKCVIEQVRFHHTEEMLNAQNLEATSLAYITHFADSITSGFESENEGWEAENVNNNNNAKLHKIFNILNGNSGNLTYDTPNYNATLQSLKEGLPAINITSENINTLLNLLESTCGNIPTSVNESGQIDVSLYDHAKTTAAIATCVFEFMESIGESNYKEALFESEKSQHILEENMFLFAQCDMSGIQDFIYNISGTKALKQLRARSMYLELMLEHIVDEMLDACKLTRANLMYSGGGNAYLLLPNTQKTLDAINNFQQELKQWFLTNYQTELFVGVSCVQCSANELSNSNGDGLRLSNLYKKLSERMSELKASRYTAAEIAQLNYHDAPRNNERECNECHRSTTLMQNDSICPLCASLQEVSHSLVRRDIFAVIPAAETPNAETQLTLPFGCCLKAMSEEEFLAKDLEVKRAYVKNTGKWSGKNVVHISMGDYTAPTKEGISGYASRSSTLDEGKGIKRLGVLRADVDNLGTVFSSGFPANKASVSRTATLSRNLGYFFKSEINDILSKGNYHLQIIYSGGDDLFIIGNWSDVLHAALDINETFQEYTGNDSLTISAGIGLFSEKFPIARMAAQTGELEDAAKLFETTTSKGVVSRKNAIALWEEHAVFTWTDFKDNVQAKERELTQIFKNCEKGASFIYKMIGLLRSFDEAISAPRLAYLLARSFEGSTKAAEYAQKIYEWATDEKQRKCLITALEWYVYSVRERNLRNGRDSS